MMEYSLSCRKLEGKTKAEPSRHGKGHNPIMPYTLTCRNHLVRSILSWPNMLMPGDGRACGGHEVILSSAEGVKVFIIGELCFLRYFL